MKTILIFALTGAAVGCISLSLLAPNMLSWYNSPGGSVQSMCACKELAEHVASQFLKIQIYGIGGGFVAGGILGFLFHRWRTKPAA